MPTANVKREGLTPLSGLAAGLPKRQSPRPGVETILVSLPILDPIHENDLLEVVFLHLAHQSRIHSGTLFSTLLHRGTCRTSPSGYEQSMSFYFVSSLYFLRPETYNGQDDNPRQVQLANDGLRESRLSRTRAAGDTDDADIGPWWSIVRPLCDSAVD